MRRPDDTRHLRHHAFVIEAPTEEGIATALTWVKEELGMERTANPDVVVLRYGLLSVEDARNIYESAVQAPFRGAHKAIVVAANRAYHEAQNALLKLFEEPPEGTYLFLVLPSLGGLLPTLRSRVAALTPAGGKKKTTVSGTAEEFIKATREKRSALIKKLTSGKDEKERRENRTEAIELLRGIESAAYAADRTLMTHGPLLAEIETLRGYLHDRSAPVKMVLEHLALVTPKNLL